MDEYRYGEHTGPVEVTPRVLDTEAEAANVFGEVVYVRGKGGKEIECPFCGRWSPLSSLHRQVHDFTCTSCKHTVAIHSVDGVGFVGIKLVDLLDVEVPRYYLPRAWSPQRWISRMDLQSKFAQFEKEIENVC